MGARSPETPPSGVGGSARQGPGFVGGSREAPARPSVPASVPVLVPALVIGRSQGCGMELPPRWGPGGPSLLSLWALLADPGRGVPAVLRL